MDISKAKKVVELTKGSRKILVTLYEGGQVSSCIEDEAKKKYCETCQFSLLMSPCKRLDNSLALDIPRPHSCSTLARMLSMN